MSKIFTYKNLKLCIHGTYISQQHNINITSETILFILSTPDRTNMIQILVEIW